jgi:DNA-binding transcriptional LysR family regulator
MIAALEAELGARLFQRTTRRIAPMKAALLFLARIEPHLEGLRQAREAIADVTDRVSGVLRVTASPSFGIECLGPLLSDFAELYPTLKVELTLTDRVVELVGERLDLALRHGPCPIRRSSCSPSSQLGTTPLRVLSTCAATGVQKLPLILQTTLA